MERKRRWRGTLADFDYGMRQRVTRSGLVFTLAILIVGLAAFASANNLLFLLLAAMLSTFLVSGLVSRLGLAGLELELGLPDHVFAREGVAGRLILRNTKRWMTSFSIYLVGAAETDMLVEVYFPVLPAGQAVAEQSTFRFARRGIHDENAFRVSSRFPFGFTERQVPVLVRQEVLVYPSLTPAPALEDWLQSIAREFASARFGRGSDFYRLRPYENTESARHIDWKVSAHTSQLQVREFADEQDRQVLLYLDLQTSDAAWFELAIECCAYLAVHIPQLGGQVQLQSQKEDALDTHTMLKMLALAEAVRESPATPPHYPHALQILFTQRPASFAEAGWAGALVVDPGRLAALAAADPERDIADRTAQDEHHGRR